MLPPANGTPRPARRFASDTSPARWDWDTLGRVIGPRLVGWGVREFGFPREVCEDTLQGVFLRALSMGPRVRDPISYVRTCFINALCDILRRRACRTQDVELDQLWHVPDPAAERLEAVRTLQGALRRIDERCRKLIEGRYLEERPLPRVAEDLGYSGKTVWKRLQQCLKRMRRCLG